MFWARRPPLQCGEWPMVALSYHRTNWECDGQPDTVTAPRHVPAFVCPAALVIEIPLTPATPMATFFQSSRSVEIILGESMKKFAIVLAAVAALVVVAAPLTSAFAANKTLWGGWMEDVKKLQSDIAAKAKAKK
jgi:hypothetical protein